METKSKIIIGSFIGAILIVVVCLLVFNGNYIISSITSSQFLDGVVSAGSIEEVIDLNVIKDDVLKTNLRTTDSVVEKDGITKIYNATEKKLKITEDDKTIIDMDLDSKYKVLIGQSNDSKIAEFNLEDFDGSIDDLFDSINFYEINKDYTEKQKDYWFKYGVDYIEEECHDLQEYSEEIEKETLFCENVTKTNWIRFDSLKELPNKNIKISLWTNTIGEKNVEWVPTIKGFEILEWAEYEIVGLASYGPDLDGDFSLEQVRSISLSSDGNYLATSSYTDDTVSIFNVTNKTGIYPLASRTDIDGDFSLEQVRSISLSSDGNYLATSSNYDDTVSIFNVTNKNSITPLASYGPDIDGDYSFDYVYSISLSSDGNYLATSSYTDDTVSIMEFREVVDTIPPTYSNNQTNTTIAGELALFSIEYNDDTALESNGGYIFSTNNSGVWTNDSLVMWTSTPEWANVTKTLPINAGNRTDYRWYANDSAGNWNNTNVFYLITTSGVTSCASNVGDEWYVPAGCECYCEGESLNLNDCSCVSS